MGLEMTRCERNLGREVGGRTGGGGQVHVAGFGGRLNWMHANKACAVLDLRLLDRVLLWHRHTRV